MPDFDKTNHLSSAIRYFFCSHLLWPFSLAMDSKTDILFFALAIFYFGFNKKTFHTVAFYHLQQQ